MRFAAVILVVLICVSVLCTLIIPSSAKPLRTNKQSANVSDKKLTDSLNQLQQDFNARTSSEEAVLGKIMQKLERIDQAGASKDDKITCFLIKDCPAVVFSAGLTALASIIGACVSAGAIWLIAKSVTDKHNVQSLSIQEKQHESNLALQRIQHSHIVEFSKLQHIQKLSVEQISTLEKFLPHLISDNLFLRETALEVILFLENDELVWKVLGVVLGTRDSKLESAAVRAQRQLENDNFSLQTAINEAKSNVSASRNRK